MSRQMFKAVVRSNLMHKTASAYLYNVRYHSKFKKWTKTRNTIMVHDEYNQLAVGDVIEVKNTRRMTKNKAFKLVRVLKAQPHVGRPVDSSGEVKLVCNPVRPRKKWSPVCPAPLKSYYYHYLLPRYVAEVEQGWTDELRARPSMREWYEQYVRDEAHEQEQQRLRGLQSMEEAVREGERAMRIRNSEVDKSNARHLGISRNAFWDEGLGADAVARIVEDQLSFQQIADWGRDPWRREEPVVREGELDLRTPRVQPAHAPSPPQKQEEEA